MSQRDILRVNIEGVRGRIADSCSLSGRVSAEVTLVAVTKYSGFEVMEALVELGITDIAENRLQVAQPKLSKLETGAARHFVGPLQSNKVRNVLRLFDVLHSLDRSSLIKALQRRLAEEGIQKFPCFLQANVSGEKSKGGFEPDQVGAAVTAVHESAPNIELIGLMTMAPFVDNPEEVRPHFARLREFRDRHLPNGGLSMGMTNDFEVAIEEGATHVRIGSALIEGLDEQALIEEVRDGK